MNIESIVDSELWDSVESNMNSGKYTNAIIDAMLFLSNVLREKSNLEDDGLKLINNIFSKKDPKIKITKLETETEKSMHDGAANILRGLYQLIRNPRHHDNIEDNENEAIKIILFIDYILSIIEKSKSKFELEDFESIVFDEEFVNEQDYTELIVNRIPKRRIYEVAISIYRKKTNGNIYHIQTFFSSLFEKLSDSEVSNFLGIISNDLLKTNDDNERKYILRCFPSNRWHQIDEISRIRTENRILKSIEEGKSYDNKKLNYGWFATWCTHLFSEFSLKEKLISTVSGMLSSNDISQIKYIFKFILNEIWEILDENQLELIEKAEKEPFFADFDYLFIHTIKNELVKGNKLFYNYIKRNRYNLPQKVNEYFKEHINNFKEDKEIKTISDDDFSPIHEENDLPF